MNKRHLTFRESYLYVVFIAFLTISCSIVGSKEDKDECKPGVIIPGECFEGVRLGDTLDRVEEILGKPVTIGWAEGIYRGWIVYVYKPQGTAGIGLEISFIMLEENKPWGPVDAIISGELYTGRTIKGIGVGSTFEEVLTAYGEPDHRQEYLDGHGEFQGNYIWCYGTIRFVISVRDELVRSFFMGYHIPFPVEQDLGYRCEISL